MNSIVVRNSKAVFASILTYFLFFPSIVFSQDNIPSIEAFQDQRKQAVIPIPDRDVEQGFGKSNPYFHETLTLHHQIGLLEQMIRRQSYIARLEKSYIELGLPFIEPAPPRGICEQIPANIPCVRSYPDIHSIELPELDNTNDFLGRLPLNVAMLKQKKGQKNETFLSDQYRQSEILCGSGVCEASIIDIMNPEKLLFLKEGDQFANNQLRVAKIWVGGVMIEERGEERELKLLEAELRDIINTKKQSIFASDDEEPELDTDMVPGTINFPDMPHQQPVLGPTGLF